MINKKDRIEAAIRHIQTSVDIDPWAMELAVEALKEKADLQPDCISRQTLQKELALYPIDDVTSEDEAGYNRAINDVQKMVLHLPSAQPEIKPVDIDYYYCSNAMLKMWIDNVLTDGEYNKIMDKLNDFERKRLEKENG